jgi:hypothetical protein
VTTGGRDKSEENDVGEEKEDAKEARTGRKRSGLPVDAMGV